MTTSWPRVRLGEVLSQVSEPHRVQAECEYPNFGMLSFGRGLFAKQPISGATTSADILYRVAKGQFIYSRLFAFEGAYGLVDQKFDGYFVSNEYPTFEVDPSRLTAEFLAAYFRWPVAWEEVATRSTGMGVRRRRVQPAQFLQHEIPLPPLAEQRRVVARIGELAAQIDDARDLRLQTDDDRESLMICMAHRRDLSDGAKEKAGWMRLTLGQCVQLVEEPERVTTDRSYPNLGIYSYGRGLFHKPAIDGLATSASTLYRVRAGQMIYSRLFAFEGAYGTVSDEFDGHFVSNEYPTFRCDARFMRIEFLTAYFKASSVWAAIAVGSKGLGDRRQRVQPKQVLEHRLWVPPLQWQTRIADVQSRASSLEATQSETSAELDALFPAILDRAFKGEL